MSKLAQVKATTAPNYHLTENDRACAGCKHIEGTECKLYNFFYENDYVCDSYESRSGLETMASIQANLLTSAITFKADESNPRFLKFTDAVLARAETNKNKDNIDVQGVKELADTIAGTPIDLDHHLAKNVGVYTAGRVGSENELRVDGILWLDRCEAINIDAQDIVDGRYGLSIEADAVSAECSVCHSVHASKETYCEHLLARARFGAERLLKGLKAVGGALTKRPAGSGTGFASSAIHFIASHDDDEALPEPVGVDALRVVLAMNEEQFKTELNKLIAEGVSRLSAQKRDELTKIYEEKSSMEAEPKDVKDSPEEEKKETSAEKSKEEELQACNDQLKAEMEAMAKKLQATETELIATKTQLEATLLAHRTAELKAQLVGSVCDEAEFEAERDTYLAMSEKVIAKLLEKAKKPAERLELKAAETNAAPQGVGKLF